MVQSTSMLYFHFIHYVEGSINCKIGFLPLMVRPLDDFRGIVRGPWIFMDMALGRCVKGP